MSKSATDPMAQAGFSLMELLVVLAVIAMLAMLLIPQLTRRPAGTQERPMMQVILTLQKAQRQAVAQSRAITPDLPDTQWRAEYPRDTTAPRFFADGSAHGGALTLANGKTLYIDWIDGHVRATQ